MRSPIEKATSTIPFLSGYHELTYPRGRTRLRASAPSAPSLPGLLPVTLLLLLASSAIPLVSAVQVRFDNCLGQSYIHTNPSIPPDKVQLQFVPKVADAVFEPVEPHGNKHNLLFSVWGDVTGRVGDAVLPPPGDPEWSQADKALKGKIEDQPVRGPNPNATTLHSTVDVLTYRPYLNDAFFCKSLLNASCPLGPAFKDESFNLTEGFRTLPSFNLSHDFGSSYAFASFSPTLIIRYGDKDATTIGCISTVLTPSLGYVAWYLKFFPLLILLLVGFATIFAAIFSPWGTSDVFHWTSNYGRDPDLLRLVTPGFADCLNYIQFVVLTGSLSLSYPGFYQPAVGQGSWSILMFNERFVSGAKSFQSLIDGIYVTPGMYGLERIAQLNGLEHVEDIWAGMVIWLLVILAAVLFLIQVGFLARWSWRLIKQDSEGGLRSKNLPFSLGNVVRLVFNYFLLPLVALSAFQLFAATRIPWYFVFLAVVALALIIGFTAWLTHLIVTTKPRSYLFDDLHTVLLYGPLYNTYLDGESAFALIPIILTIIRGIAIGAVQASGTAQIPILAVCEVVQLLTLLGFRPFHRSTSMNAYHIGLSTVRFVTIVLMIAFTPSLGLTEGPKGWIGYAILLVHGSVLVFGFFLNSVQTIFEVAARLCGVGRDAGALNVQTRGGLSKIFGARELSRRVDRPGNQSRLSQLSSTGMLDAAENPSKSGYGRIRSESAGSMGILMSPQRNSSAMDSRSIDAYSNAMGSSTLASTPREVGSFSFLPSREAARPQPTADPYYRPPRMRRGITDETGSSLHRTQGSAGSIEVANPRSSQAGSDFDVDFSGGAAPGPLPYAPVFAPRADYSTREVDFYYGVRGPALNSDHIGRKLGTGPADPMRPVATATGWLTRLFGGKTKEKGKGFEVVRSSRMPPAMKARGGDYSDEGIPVALNSLRNGPIESDDEDDTPKPKRPAHAREDSAGIELLKNAGDPELVDEIDNKASRSSNEPPSFTALDAGESFQIPKRGPSKASRHPSQRTVRLSASEDIQAPEVPDVPRKSSKRHSTTEQMLPFSPLEERSSSRPRSGHASEESHSHLAAPARLPFDRSNSQDSHHTSAESGHESADEQPANFGRVHQRNISRNEPDESVDLLGSSAEVVFDGRKSSASPAS